MQKIIILDFGSQTTQLIGRRVRELDTFCEILPYNKFHTVEADLQSGSIIGVILSGSPFSVHDPEAFKVDLSQFVGRVPVLGICYGAQFISHTLGGRVEKADSREYGRANLETIDLDSPLFRGFEKGSQVWMSHGDTITAIPDGFKCIASTKDVKYAAYSQASVFAVQFHPEVYHTVQGKLLLKNFVVGICGSRQEWSAASFVDTTVKELKEQLGQDRVILGLSGGVDSSVAAVLLNRAVGDRLTCIFVDHGMLRKNEFRQVMDDYRGLGLNVVGIDASEKFFADLAGITDPEQKRKIIGRDFIEVFNAEAMKIITSPCPSEGGESQPAAVVPSLSGRSPAAVPSLSEESPLSSSAVVPSLSGRSPASVPSLSEESPLSPAAVVPSLSGRSPASVPSLSEESPLSSAAVVPSLSGRSGKVWLAQGTIYPDRIESLNITGKVIKSHHNVGGLPKEMNLQLCEPLKWLFKDEVRRVGRQLGMPEHLITRHPFPGPGLAVRILGDITPEKVRILQDADDIYIRGLREYKVKLSGEEARRVLAAGVPTNSPTPQLPNSPTTEIEVSLYDQIWQAGAILLSTVRSVGVMGDERTYEHPVALRAVTSTDAMTADWAHLPYDFLARVSNEIINKVRGVNRVCYDISSKPPATIEWE